jgi:K+-transporting ATPase KdpF subunit
MDWETQILAIIFAVTPNLANTAIANETFNYIIGSGIALLILGYLVYTLLRPDKF